MAPRFPQTAERADVLAPTPNMSASDSLSENRSEGFLEDTLAGIRPWGFRPDAIGVPVLIMHGAEDKMVACAHGEWLAARCPAAELRIVADAGHITVLDSAREALAWLAALVRA